MTGVWGELKQSTVLFADIVSSTEQIANLDPEGAMERLQPALMTMCEIVERFGGTVVRTLGDGVMALFGVPKALELHASLACEAALCMQAAFPGAGGGLRIRVGLHSGQVAADPREMENARGGGAHGLTIHLANRVMSVAEPGGITLTSECHGLVRGAFEARSLGHQMLKGLFAPVEVFVLAGLKSGFALQHFRQATLTRFRGRSAEMGALQQAQYLSETGSARIVGISGDPGSGKSRLCYEFAQWARARNVPVFEIRAQHLGNAVPLQPVLELLRGFVFRISALDDVSLARRRVEERLIQIGPQAEEDFGLLCDFLGLGPRTEGVYAAGAKARRSRLLRCVNMLVRHVAAEPAVVLIEDLHWLDDPSREFIGEVLSAALESRTLFVLNYRPSYHPPWSGLAQFVAMTLGELSAADIDGLVRDLISNRRAVGEISKMVARRSGGNPFFAEELVRSLAESGALAGEAGLSSQGIESVERSLPATVQAVIAARIDHLRESEKSLLQTCAIIGKEVPLNILERVAGPMGADIVSGLEGLCQTELLRSEMSHEVQRFSFRHPLIQEVAYGSQLKARRVFVHASVAAAMEACYADSLDEHAGLVAHHFEAAGQHFSAARYAGRAALWLSSTDSSQAIKQWQRARALLDQHGHGRDVDELRAMACSQIALLGWREGLSLQEVQPFIDEAVSLANETDNQLTPLLLMVEGRMLQASGGPADWYVERMQQALNVTPASTERGRAAMLQAALCQAYGWAGLMHEALRASEVALRDVDLVSHADREFLGFNIEQWLLGMRGRLLLRLGRPHEARQSWERMLTIDARSMDPAIEVILHIGHIELAWGTGDGELADDHARQLVALAERHAMPYLRTVASWCQGLASMVSHDLAGAIERLSAALALIRGEQVAVEYETEVLACLAESHRLAGDGGAARAVAREAIEMSRHRNTRLCECRALITLAAQLARDQRPGAGELFEQARALIDRTGAAVYADLLETARSETSA